MIGYWRKIIGTIGCGVAAGCLVLLVGCRQTPPVSTQGAAQAQSGAQPANRFAFSIEHPVADCSGRTDLSAQDFMIEAESPDIKIQVEGAKLAECSRPASSRVAMSIAMAMDHSWSLYDRVQSLGGYVHFNRGVDAPGLKEPGTDPDGMRLKAARNFLNQLSPGTRVLLAYFSAENQDYQIVSSFEDGVDRAKAALNQLPSVPANRGTPLWNTLMGLLDALSQEPAGRQRSIVCFTDGDNMLRPGLPTYQSFDVIEKATRFKIPIFFVLLGSRETLPNFEEVRRKVENIAEATGGRLIPAAEASGLQQAFHQLNQAVHVIPCYRVKCFAVRSSPFQPGESIMVRVRAHTGGEERVYEIPHP